MNNILNIYLVIICLLFIGCGTGNNSIQYKDSSSLDSQDKDPAENVYKSEDDYYRMVADKYNIKPRDSTASVEDTYLKIKGKPEMERNKDGEILLDNSSEVYEIMKSLDGKMPRDKIVALVISLKKVSPKELKQILEKMNWGVSVEDIADRLKNQDY